MSTKIQIQKDWNQQMKNINACKDFLRYLWLNATILLAVGICKDVQDVLTRLGVVRQLISYSESCL